MKKIIALLTILLLQSCIVNIKQDYNGYSRNLVFEQNKKTPKNRSSPTR